MLPAAPTPCTHTLHLVRAPAAAAPSAVRRWKLRQHAAAASEPYIASGQPPVFDGPGRQPSAEEAAAVAAGATLTPDQRLAQQLQLPITLRVHVPRGVPSERQLMAQLKAAASWRELEAVVYQRANEAAAAAAAAAAAVTTTAQVEPSAHAAAAEQAQPQQPVQRPRRRQQPQPLSVQPMLSSSPAAAAAPPPPQQQPPLSAAAAAPVLASAAAATAAAAAGRGPAAGPLNHMHVTEALRRLAALLPASPQQLPPAERAAAAALVHHLCRAALAHAEAQQLDARAVAHIASALVKLGHRDAVLLAELQVAALLQLHDFSSQHIAMLLSALAHLGTRPEQELLLALQGHIAHNLHLFKHQSMANTIWALAKLQQQGAAATAAAASPPAAAHGDAAGGSGRSSSDAAVPAAVPIVPQVLRDALVARCHPQMHCWSGHHIAQAAWGLSRLGARPDAAWCQSLLLASARRLDSMSAQDMANLAAALPELRASPDEAWLDGFCAAAAVRLRRAAPLGVHSLLFGLARLKQQQQRRCAAAVARQQQDQQGSAGDADAATAQPAGAAFGSDAELRLLLAAVRRLQQLHGALCSRQVAGAVMSLAELLPDDVLHELAAARAEQQPRQQAAAAHPDCDQRRALAFGVARLLEDWEPAMASGALGAGLRKRQAGLLRLAWGRLSAPGAVASTA